jgi:hypothetical protein
VAGVWRRARCRAGFPLACQRAAPAHPAAAGAGAGAGSASTAGAPAHLVGGQRGQRQPARLLEAHALGHRRHVLLGHGVQLGVRACRQQRRSAGGGGSAARWAGFSQARTAACAAPCMGPAPAPRAAPPRTVLVVEEAAVAQRKNPVSGLELRGGVKGRGVVAQAVGKRAACLLASQQRGGGGPAPPCCPRPPPPRCPRRRRPGSARRRQRSVLRPLTLRRRQPIPGMRALWGASASTQRPTLGSFTAILGTLPWRVLRRASKSQQMWASD